MTNTPTRQEELMVRDLMASNAWTRKQALIALGFIADTDADEHD